MPKRQYNNLTGYRLLHVVRNSPFYEEYGRSGYDEPFELEVPEGWSTKQDAVWKYYFPADCLLPEQGWKIHLSACPADADKMLRMVSSYLFARKTPFKHLVSERSFRRSNMKYSNRASSGKFFTVYPNCETDFLELLEELDEMLVGFNGPYVLSDTRYKESPVFFRYGAFLYRSFESESGDTLFAIEDDEGRYLEDKRLPYFTLPDFVEVPEPISEQVYSRLNPDPTDLARGLYPFTVRDSLHFSNGGGVYLANNAETGEIAVLKEGRPYSAYTDASESAIVRLRRERKALESLQGIQAVPRYIDYREVDGHEFLIESYLSGDSLQSWVASHFPFSLNPSDIEEYQRSALAIAKKLLAIVNEIHDRNIAIMDINAKNVLIDEQANPLMIDFEGCRQLNEENAEVLGTPGFIPFSNCSNYDRDAFGMASLFMYMFWPSWGNAFSPEIILANMEKVKCYYSDEVIEFLNTQLGMVPAKLFEPRFGLRHLTASDKGYEWVIERLVEGIKRVRNPNSSEKRLYPGDATQFLKGLTGKYDIETGTAGIILALHCAGVDIDADANWLRDALRADDHAIPFHGLLRGQIGIASVFSQVGLSEYALELLPDQLPDHALSDLSMRTGLAGTVLALCEIFVNTNDPKVELLLDEAADQLMRSIREVSDLSSPGSETGNAVGLFDGWSGVALACRELSFACPRSAQWADAVNYCLDKEVLGLSKEADSSLYVDYAGVKYGYLSEGIAGIAFALSVCGYPDNDIVKCIRPSLSEYISLNGNLFRGIGGKAAALWSIDSENNKADVSLMMGNVLDSFLFSEKDEEAIYVLGDGGACLSADYSTGAAGLISVLLSLEHGQDLWFPVSLH